MTTLDLEDLSKALEATQTTGNHQNGLTFENRNLKLDTVEDAKELVDAMNNCHVLEYLNLAGNTLGVEASEAIAKALEKHPEFRRALWKDLFTGRLKDEIPKSLRYLGEGLVKADARLIELDLSDNAFGPIGVKGLAELLSSPACYNLHHLRLNNNGLGIGGAKLLAKALTDCLLKSRQAGTPLTLRTFIAGRNRLENEGATALASVFSDMTSLQEFAVPQNGIYHVGITALSAALSKNTNLHTVNFNDNTVGPKGAASLAQTLVHLPELHTLNLGDCLLRNKGALTVAPALKHLMKLQNLILDYNEIKSNGAEAVVRSVIDKKELRSLGLDGNLLGGDGEEKIRGLLNEAGGNMKEVLMPMDGNESPDEDENDDDDDDEDEELEEEEEDEGSGSEDEEEEEEENEVEVVKIQNGHMKPITVSEFLNCPTSDRFLAIGGISAATILSNEAESEGFGDDTPPDVFLNTFIPVLMKVSGLATDKDASMAAMICSNYLYKRLFEWARGGEQRSVLVDNALLVQLGLIKAEDKKYRPPWNIPGCMKALDEARKQPFFPKRTDECVRLFVEKKKDVVEPQT